VRTATEDDNRLADAGVRGRAVRIESSARPADNSGMNGIASHAGPAGAGAGLERRGGRGSALAGWGFLVCAAIAVGYGLWALYGSGARVVVLDAMAAEGGTNAELGPLPLEPGMSPMRAVLHMGYAPVGSRRTRYRIELVDPAGRAAWVREGAVGNKDDEASFVRVTTSVATFDVAAAGPHIVRVRFEDGTMDDLREAAVELRRDVARVDTRITWGFGLAACVLLIARLIVDRRRPWPYRASGDLPRAAA
jgi:hypothetical protein